MSGKIENIISDLRFAARLSARTPGLTLIVVLSLALGIGANTAVFSLVNAVMFRLLPVKTPEQIYFLTDAPKEAASTSIREVATPYFSYDEYKIIREKMTTFSGVAAFRNTGRVSASYEGRAGIVEGQIVSGNYFSLLGVSAFIGRAFNESEDGESGANPVAVISHQFWQREFGGDSSVIGQTLTLNTTPFTIIGVLPAEFFGLEPGAMPGVWVPVSMKDQVTTGRDPGTEMVGRLNQGTDDRQAQAELAVIFDQILAQRAEGVTNSEEREDILGRAIQLTPGSKGLRSVRDEIGDPVLVMMIIVAMVLAVACANVATLILVKATRRQKEFATRMALGASRGRLIRQLLAESLFLTAIGGLLGILIANWSVRSLLNLLASGPNPVRLEAGADFSVIAYTALILGLTVTLFGLVPALRATRIDLAPTLKENASAVIGGSRIGISRVLVVLQVALSLVLLTGAGLFIRTLMNVRSLELGFKPEAILIATADASLVGYKGSRSVALYKEIGERIRQLNGVRSASLSAFSPIGQLRAIAMIQVPGHVAGPGEEPVISINNVGDDYFETLSIPLVAGRGIKGMDDENSPKIVVINESLARKYFRGEEAVGKTVNLRFLTGLRAVEIVGVVKDAKYSRIKEEIAPTAYIPFVQSTEARRMTFLIRAESDPYKLVADIRRIVAEIDSNVGLFDVKTIEDQIDESLVQERLTARLSGFFGLLALLLACIGLFGMTSYEVTRRTNEIGIRMALGATSGRMLWTVMRSSLALVLTGIVIGFIVALIFLPKTSKLLFGLTASDPLTFTMAAAVLTGAAIVASYIPARRASRIDPLVAIRYE